MKILITGSTGLLGQALIQRLARSCELVGVSRHPAAVGGLDGPSRHVVCDLADAQATEQLVQQVQPDVVIHTQAMSDVDRCELEPSMAQLHNVQTLAHLCDALPASEPLVVALSTDYVFDGTKGRPYVESDEPRPLSVYGKSKLAAEQVALRYPRGVVVRSSTLFGAARTNFCDTLVQRVRRGEPIEAFVDQTTSPTYTEDLADALARLVDALVARSRQGWPRIYHLTNAGGCGRIEFARYVVDLLGGSESLIRPIRMQERRQPAPRPAYSVLTSEHLEAPGGITLRPWHEAVHAYLTSRHWVN